MFLKHKTDKPMLSHLPAGQIETVMQVLDHGAKKYSRNNWQKGGFHVYASAALRHVFARIRGEKIDRESGLPHLAHAVCCLLFLMWFDDRDAEKQRVRRAIHNSFLDNDNTEKVADNYS